MLDFQNIGVQIQTEKASSYFTEDDLNFLRGEVSEHHCYHNSFLCCLFHRQTKRPSYYVEGYVETTEGEMIPHAFNMREKCYDLTKHFFFDEAELTYYMKRVYRYEEIKAVFERTGKTFLTFTPEGERRMNLNDIYILKKKSQDIEGKLLILP